MCNRLHTIPACDGQADGQTSCHGIIRAMHTRRAVKTSEMSYSYSTTTGRISIYSTTVLRTTQYAWLGSE